MEFKAGDKVEFIYRNKKSVGEINGVYPETQEVSIKQSDSPVDLLFSNKFIVKIEEQERLVVPQCVADWYEDNKDKLDYSIWKYIRNWEYHEEDGFFNFMNDNDSKSIETLNKMRNGYEVEKEPVWVVENENGYRLRSITMNPGNSLNWSFDSKNKNYIEFEEFETAKKAAYLVTGNVTEI
ncbi:TPA: DUF1642 domain-containing protein [Listeria monocytogenes]|uniref:DUF1642 domain-containing protein n=1 Tax=Listeria monocytogenes TaxID=1639 RepID=UPI00098D54A6|nr:DUF1642 domain-containing protein [Listeria monocytogenes]